MTAVSPYAGLVSPREVGQAMATHLVAVNGRHFTALLDKLLDHMRAEMVEAGHPASITFLICRETRVAALQAWHLRAAGGEG